MKGALPKFFRTTRAAGGLVGYMADVPPKRNRPGYVAGDAAALELIASPTAGEPA